MGQVLSKSFVCGSLCCRSELLLRRICLGSLCWSANLSVRRLFVVALLPGFLLRRFLGWPLLPDRVFTEADSFWWPLLLGRVFTKADFCGSVCWPTKFPVRRISAGSFCCRIRQQYPRIRLTENSWPPARATQKSALLETLRQQRLPKNPPY